MSKTIYEMMNSITDTMQDEEASKTRRGPVIMINDDTLAKAESDISTLRDLLGLNSTQVLILTGLVSLSSHNQIDKSDIAWFLGIKYLKFLSYADDFEELKRRGYIRLKKDGDVVIPPETLKNLKENRAVEPETTSGLDTSQILSRLHRKLKMLEDEEMTQDDFMSDANALMTDNPGTSIARVYGNLNNKGVPSAQRLLFIAVLNRYVFEDDDEVAWFNVESYFEEGTLDSLRWEYKQEIMRLQTMGILEYAGENGVQTKDYFKIKDEVKEEALVDIGGLKKKEQRVSASSKVTAGSITKKELFYNPTEQRQVDQLNVLLGDGRFQEIRSKMKDKGLRTGFSCLFYGGPGTGKTETVYQLARQSGRDLFVVDVAQIKSCWVGESEKNIKRVFSRYRECVKNGSTIPILLFNEADAIFGIRREGAGDAVDKMENSIQNIILQEMEDLDGILIAITNLTCNLDRAFERRFLYKVRFDKPSVEARSHIWTTMIPELSQDEALKLAATFDFSGGQIENISRKKTVNELIDGTIPSFDQILQFCSEENIGEQSERKRIGFC